MFLAPTSAKTQVNTRQVRNLKEDMKEQLLIQTWSLRFGCVKLTVVFPSLTAEEFYQFRFVQHILLWPFLRHSVQCKWLRGIHFKIIFRMIFQTVRQSNRIFISSIYLPHSLKRLWKKLQENIKVRHST